MTSTRFQRRAGGASGAGAANVGIGTPPVWSPTPATTSRPGAGPRPRRTGVASGGDHPRSPHEFEGALPAPGGGGRRDPFGQHHAELVEADGEGPGGQQLL